MLLMYGDIDSTMTLAEGPDMTRSAMLSAVRTTACTAIGAVIAALNFAGPLHAQTAAINDLRGKIFDAKMARDSFAGGLPHCAELDGTNFYFPPRDRVLSLQDYKRSLESLVLGQVFNPDTKKPWSQDDADTRWKQVQQLATTDQTNCALVASLPDLLKKLEALQAAAAQNAASKNSPPPNNK
jgi:hypothetical protein